MRQNFLFMWFVGNLHSHGNTTQTGEERGGPVDAAVREEGFLFCVNITMAKSLCWRYCEGKSEKRRAEKGHIVNSWENSGKSWENLENEDIKCKWVSAEIKVNEQCVYVHVTLYLKNKLPPNQEKKCL